MQNDYLRIEDMLSLVSQKMINSCMWFWKIYIFFLSLFWMSHLDLAWSRTSWTWTRSWLGLDSPGLGLGLDSDSIVLVLDSTKVDLTTAPVHWQYVILDAAIDFTSESLNYSFNGLVKKYKCIQEHNNVCCWQCIYWPDLVKKISFYVLIV